MKVVWFNRNRSDTRGNRGRWRMVATAAIATLVGTFGVAAPAQAAVPDAFGFALWEGAPFPANATPAGTQVIVSGVGRYRVIFPGQAGRGVAHVTAVSTVARWCQIEGFGPSGVDEVVGVVCFAPGGVLADTRFSVIYSSSSGPLPPPAAGRFGYVDSQPTGLIISQYNSVGAVNTVTPGPVGVWVVRMPGLITPGPVAGSLQATAVSPQIAARCKVSAWAALAAGQAVRVQCFNAAGAPVNVRFTLTYQYQQSLYGPAYPPQYFGYLWWTPPLGPALTNFNSQFGAGVNTAIVSGPGLVYATFPGVGPRPDNVQVTAFGVGSEFCGLQFPWVTAGTTTHVRNVNCWTNAGAPANVGFFLSYNSRF